MGLAMGLFLGALDNPVEEMSGRQQLIFQAKQMGRRSVNSAKAFSVMGLIFSAVECIVEQVNYRGKEMINLNLSVVHCATCSVITVANLEDTTNEVQFPKKS
jgi:mitochondrial import inner membrane translocase subunit TIM22